MSVIMNPVRPVFRYPWNRGPAAPADRAIGRKLPECPYRVVVRTIRLNRKHRAANWTCRATCDRNAVQGAVRARDQPAEGLDAIAGLHTEMVEDAVVLRSEIEAE